MSSPISGRSENLRAGKAPWPSGGLVFVEVAKFTLWECDIAMKNGPLKGYLPIFAMLSFHTDVKCPEAKAFVRAMWENMPPIGHRPILSCT
jgi:hypothetical protein